MSAYSDIMKEKGIQPQQAGVKIAEPRGPKPAGTGKKKTGKKGKKK